MPPSTSKFYTKPIPVSEVRRALQAFDRQPPHECGWAAFILANARMPIHVVAEGRAPSLARVDGDCLGTKRCKALNHKTLQTRHHDRRERTHGPGGTEIADVQTIRKYARDLAVAGYIECVRGWRGNQPARYRLVDAVTAAAKPAGLPDAVALPRNEGGTTSPRSRVEQ